MYLEIFLADFAVFGVFLGISRVRDRAKYQKRCKVNLKIGSNTKPQLETQQQNVMRKFTIIIQCHQIRILLKYCARSISFQLGNINITSDTFFIRSRHSSACNGHLKTQNFIPINLAIRSLESFFALNINKRKNCYKIIVYKKMVRSCIKFS